MINTVGVKLIDDSRNGVAFKEAMIVDEDGKVISTMKSNEYGMGKFSFSPLKDKSYSIQLTTSNGDKLTQPIPKAEDKEINLSTVQREDDYLVYIRTNDATRKDIEDRTYYMAISRDGQISEFDFKFPENDNQVNIKLPLDSLYAGVNILTVLDSKFNPLVERLIFSDANLKRSRINSNLQNQGDSLVVELSSDPNLQNASLSVSVLPGKTKAYNQNHNLLSAVYLKPYTKGAVENPSYYFSEGDRRQKRHDLDILLLTQGWSRYDWASTFKAPQHIVKHDTGFKIQGQVINYKKNKDNKLVVRSSESGLFKVVELEDDGSFKFPNIYLLDNAEVSFRLLQGTREVKPLVNLYIRPEDQPSSIRLTNISEYVIPRRSLENNTISLPGDFLKNSETLDTVVVETKDRKNEFENKRVYGDVTTITDDMTKKYQYLTDWLATQNFIVFQNFDKVTIRNTILSTINSESNHVLLYLNGVQVGTDANFVRDILMENVESVEINRRGYGMGMNGVNGAININLGHGPVAADPRKVHTVIADNGFNKNKQFYAPKYASYQHDLYQHYGVIDWQPVLNLDEEGKVTFKVLNTAQPSVKLFIEGLSANGSIISEEIVVD